MVRMQNDKLTERTINSNSRPFGKPIIWAASGCFVLTVCLACFVVITALGTILISRSERSTGELMASSGDVITPTEPGLPTVVTPPATSSPTPVRPTTGPVDQENEVVTAAVPTATATPEIPAPDQIRQGAPSESSFQHLSELLAADYPARDYFETAKRLGRFDVGSRTVEAQAFQVGDRESFNTDDGLREAVLLAVTDHTYFWFESTLDYDQALIQRAAQQFEEEYYPAVAKLYGTDWQNGIDDDPRFSALHLDGYAEGNELGFFNSGDQYPRTVNASSNEQEVIYLNMENLRPGEPLYFGTLVHELQHLIQWHSDPNEPVWLSEGLAQFTELYVGLETVDTTIDYLSAPETKLNTWLYDAGDEIFAHYGAAYLFVVYFWEQFGDQAIQELMRHPADGLAGFSAVLAERDPATSLDQFVLDWATANYLDDQEHARGFGYEHLTLERAEIQEEIDQSPHETLQVIEQFGVAYVDLQIEGEHTLAFAGDSTVELVPATPYSGETMWYVPGLNELDAQLTASFDLTGLTSASLNFRAWYELEEDYDFAYVSASTDAGATWDLLMPAHAEAGEYGPALTGQSADLDGNRDGWVEESVSLDAYAGNPVLLRFEVLSDSAMAESGFAVDDITIPELVFYDDVENGPGSWQSRGFVRTGRQVPQIWRLNLIVNGPTPRVVALDLDDGSQGKWDLDFGDQGAVLVVTAQTPFVTSPTNYWLAVDP